MIAYTHNYTVDLDSGTLETRWDTPLTYGDKNADKIQVTLMRGSVPATVSSLTAILYGVMSDGTTAFMAGSAMDNVVTCELDHTFYAVPGKIDLLLQLSEGTTVRDTPLRITAYVKFGPTDELVSTGEQFSLAELEAIAAACEAATDEANTATAAAKEELRPGVWIGDEPPTEPYYRLWIKTNENLAVPMPTSDAVHDVDYIGADPYGHVDYKGVRYGASQELTDAQKQQARTNIGVDSMAQSVDGVSAGSGGDIDLKAVRYGAALSLTDAQIATVIESLGLMPGARSRYVQGMEYLICYHDKIREGEAVKLIFSGDSTIYGTSLTDAGFKIDALAKTFLARCGVLNVTTINAGHEGAKTSQWYIDGSTDYLAADLAQTPDVIVLRWGVNDGDEPEATRLATFTAALRGGLAYIRSLRDVDDLSIILMMPNSTSDDEHTRNAEWYELIYPVVLQAAKDYQCCFVDTYHFLLDSTTVTWQDTFTYGHIHPLETANAWIASLLAECLVPTLLRNPGVYYPQSTVADKLSTAAPSTYPYGISIYRTGSSSWPYDGTVITYVSADGLCFQLCVGYQAQVLESYAWRRGIRLSGVSGALGSDAWEDWVHVGATETPVAMTLQNSWAAYGEAYQTPKYYKDTSGVVHLTGLVKDGTMTLGTAIAAALPAGFRPGAELVFPVACDAGASSVKITTGGILQTFLVTGNSWMTLDGVAFRAEQ